jgi:hypothetical protein
MSRRWFLLRVGACLLAPLGLGRCSGRGMSRDDTLERARALDPALDCDDTAGLWPAEVRTRTDNEYRERSDRPLEFCFNCKNFAVPPRGSGCGSCATVKGPINPGGGCKSWTEQV